MREDIINNIRNEVKAYIAKRGFTLTEIVNKMNESREPLPEKAEDKVKGVEYQTTTQNISNKLTRGTIKYSEIKEIADIIGYKIKWEAE